MTEQRDDSLAVACRALDQQVTLYRTALEIIAGRRQCLDNLMGHVDVACAALDHKGPFVIRIESHAEGASPHKETRVTT